MNEDTFALQSSKSKLVNPDELINSIIQFIKRDVNVVDIKNKRNESTISKEAEILIKLKINELNQVSIESCYNSSPIYSKSTNIQDISTAENPPNSYIPLLEDLQQHILENEILNLLN